MQHAGASYTCQPFLNGLISMIVTDDAAAQHNRDARTGRAITLTNRRCDRFG
jgi:hypothetical protein